MHRFRELHFWRRSKLLCVEIYGVTNGFPQSEQFGITNQIRRSAVSIPSNIAEGAGRGSDKDFVRFLSISLGSAHELETQLSIAFEVGFLEEDKFNSIHKELYELIRMISKFRSNLKISSE